MKTHVKFQNSYRPPSKIGDKYLNNTLKTTRGGYGGGVKKCFFFRNFIYNKGWHSKNVHFWILGTFGFHSSKVINHQKWKILVPSPHNYYCIMWGSDKNFSVFDVFELINCKNKKSSKFKSGHFCCVTLYLGGHAKFQNHSCCLYGRKVRASEEDREKNNVNNSGHYVCDSSHRQRTHSARTNFLPKEAMLLYRLRIFVWSLIGSDKTKRDFSFIEAFVNNDIWIRLRSYS